MLLFFCSRVYPAVVWYKWSLLFSYNTPFGKLKFETAQPAFSIKMVNTELKQWNTCPHTCCYFVPSFQFRHYYWFPIFKSDFTSSWEARVAEATIYYKIIAYITLTMLQLKPAHTTFCLFNKMLEMRGLLIVEIFYRKVSLFSFYGDNTRWCNSS